MDLDFQIEGTVFHSDWCVDDRVCLDAVDRANVPQKIKDLLGNPDLKGVDIDSRKYDVTFLISGVRLSQLQSTVDKLFKATEFEIRISAITCMV